MLDILFREKEENYNEILYDIGNKNIHTDTLSFFLKEILKSKKPNKVLKFKNIIENKLINSVIIFLTLLYVTRDNPKNILFVLNNFKDMKKVMSLIKEYLNFEDLYIMVFGHRLFKFNTGQKVYFLFLETNDNLDYVMDEQKYDYIVYSCLNLDDPKVILNYSKIKKPFIMNNRADTLQILIDNFKYSYNV